MKLVFSPIARREIDEASDWYEERREGLGQMFYDRVDEAAKLITTNPEAHPEVYKELRRANLEQFPYSLWYLVRSDNSLVIACLHGRRDLRLVRERALGVIPKP